MTLHEKKLRLAHGFARQLARTLVVLVLPAVASLALAGSARAVTWNVNPFSYWLGAQATLAQDGATDLHFAMKTSAPGLVGNIHYMKRTAGVWGASELVRSGSNHQYSRVAVDAAGNPYIGYFEGNANQNGVFMFASRSGGTWTSVQAATQCASSSTISLSIDGTGKPHALFSTFTPNASSMTLNYLSKNANGAWFSEPLSSNTASPFSALVLNASGVPCIAYTKANGDLYYGTRTNGVWSDIVLVDNSSDFSMGVSLVLTAAGEPRIAYFDFVTKQLKVAARTNGVWNKKIIDTASNVGAGSALALTTDGRMIVTYWDRANWDARYALQNTPGNLDDWQRGLIDATPVSPVAPGDYVPVPMSMTMNGDEVRLIYGDVFRSPTRTYFASANLIAPPAITNLVAGFGRTTWAVSWAAPTGAASYELRRASSAITTEAAWSAATVVATGAASPGEALCQSAADQPSCTPFYFAVKHAAAGGATSLLSNSPGGTTRCTGTIQVMCDIGGGGVLAETEGASRLELAAPIPNPARGSSFLRFSVPGTLAGTNARLGIYDPQGRLLRTLIDGPATAGEMSARWDLSSESGARVAPGLYFARLVVGGQSQTRTVLVTH